MGKKKVKNFFTNRILYVGIIVAAVFVIFAVRLYNLQIVNGKSYSDQAEKINTYTISLDAPRGKIYDRNGVLLATNREAYKVNMVNTKDDQEIRDRMYCNLITLFEQNNDTYINSLKRYLMTPTEWGNSLIGDSNAAARTTWINKTAMRKEDRDLLSTPYGAFTYLRSEVFEISDEYSDEDAYKIMILRYETYIYGLDSVKPTVISTDCCEETMQILSSRHLDFPGITTEKTYFRTYINTECVSQVIGYARLISSEEYEAMKDKGYANDDIIGKVGIEQSMESYLRGTKGSRVVYKNEEGEICELSYTPPVAGNDVYLTIDITLQQNAYNSLKKTINKIAAAKDNGENHGDCRTGSAVVSDVNTGEVLVMASYPGYDNNIFARPSSDAEAQQAITDLFADPDAPSLNRAIQGVYQIGSSFKPIVGMAAIDAGAIDEETVFECNKVLLINGRQHKCLELHKKVNLENAIAQSCNIYFYQAGIRTGIEKIDSYAKKFGLGEKTGIELAENQGYRSNPATMALKEKDKTHVWSDSDTAQTSIGQLYTGFTPLQVNRYVSTIAANGYLNSFTIVKLVKSSDGATVKKTEVKRERVTEVTDRAIYDVQQGMKRMGRTNGTVLSAFSSFPKGFVASKTGSVQVGTNEDSSNGVFVCYAPAENPEISIALVVEHAVYGGNTIPIAGDIANDYFGERYTINGIQTQKPLSPNISLGEGMTVGHSFRTIQGLIKTR